MNHSLRARIGAATFLCLAAACSSSSSEGDAPTIASAAVQDLDQDPNGLVTSVELGREVPFLGVGGFEADGGQNAVSVTHTGTTAFVTWDARVSPADKVRVVGVTDVFDGWRTVTTTDSRQPDITITSATQDTSDNLLGGDELVITFSNGPRIVETLAEDPDSWQLVVSGTTLDLSDSTFDLDATSQVLTITLGPSAALWASFDLTPLDVKSVAEVSVPTSTINGVATGDTTIPTFEGAQPLVQNLSVPAGGDEYGRILDIDFSEPISPVFGVAPSNFDVIDHANSTEPTLVSNVDYHPTDESIVRVTFTRPVVPGLDQVRVNNVRDEHGNLFSTATAPISAGSTVANGFTSVQGITREGNGNDQVVVVLDQAVDPDTATDPTRWSVTLGAPFGPINLATQRTGYDLLTRTLTIDLNFDFPNGTTVDVQSLGQVDVDGDTFSAAATQVAASGDSTAPTVMASGITQRRDVAPDGKTIDVVFTEGLDQTSAETIGAYTFAPAVTVDSATLLADGMTVRLALDSVAVPGDHTLTVAATVADPAGNTLAAPFGPAAIVSTDTTAPGVQLATAQAIEGADNDKIFVLFNDDMIEAEVENLASWTFESPVGNAIDVTTSTVDYDTTSRMATVVLDGAAVKRGDDLSVEFITMRDIAGNTVSSGSTVGGVTGETNRPSVEEVWRRDAPNDNEVIVRFSEASDRLTDLYNAVSNPTGAKFELYDSGAVFRGYPASATVLDGGLGVELAFPFAVALTDRLDVSGLEDLAGNVMFPTLSHVIAAEDATAPAQSAAPTMVAISGERNDVIQVTFNVPMASWRINDPSNYALQESGGGAVIDLSGSSLRYDGLNTLNVVLSSRAAASLQAGTTYDLTMVVDGSDPLRTAQGVPLAANDTEINVVIGGDTTNGPTQGASSAVLDPNDPNALFVLFDEAVDETAAETAAAYDYDGGNVALSATLVAPRVVHATFGVPIVAGQSVDVTTTAAVDLAGNAAAGTLTLSVVDDNAAPLLNTVVAAIDDDELYDVVTVSFNEPVTLATVLSAANYTLTDSRGTVTVYAVDWRSAGLQATLYVGNLIDGDTYTLSIDGISDFAGNIPSSPLTIGGAVSGDTTAPAIAGAFVNLGLDATGQTVEIEFTEALQLGVVDQIVNWSTTGAASVTAVEMIASDHARISLDAPLAASDEIVLAAGVADLAGNATSTDLTIDPVD